MLVREVFQAIEKDLERATGYRYIKNNLDKEALAYWVEPGIFAIAVYRSVGRLFARALATTPLMPYEYKRIYEVGVEPAVQFVTEHGGFVDENETKNLGIGEEVGRVNITSLAWWSTDQRWHEWEPKTYAFFRRKGEMRIYAGRRGLFSPCTSRWELEEFLKSYSAGVSERPSAPKNKREVQEVYLRSGELPKECIDFVERKTLLSGM